MASHRGFTLVEMLVAIGILLVLSALTLTMVNVTSNADRIRSASRDVQAYLEGARNQAIYSKQVRGVRFIQPGEDKSTITSMVYIGTPGHFDAQTIGVTQGSNIITIPPGIAPAWQQFRERELLVDGARIKIPKTGGDWYTIAWDAILPGWRLTKPYSRPTAGTETYSVELAPAILPFQEPKTLPQRVAIDLDNSKLPSKWIVANGPPATYSQQMDILFGPRGEVYGTATGYIHLLLSDTADTTVNCPLPTTIAPWASGSPYASGAWVTPTGTGEYQYLCTVSGNSGATEPPEFSSPKVGQSVADGTATWLCHARRPSIIMSLATGTGEVASHPVHPTDPFLYAETGAVAQ